MPLMCFSESPLIAFLCEEKNNVKRIPQDKGATGSMQREEACKGFSGNPVALCSGGVAHFLGNSFSPRTNLLLS